MSVRLPDGWRAAGRDVGRQELVAQRVLLGHRAPLAALPGLLLLPAGEPLDVHGRGGGGGPGGLVDLLVGGCGGGGAREGQVLGGLTVQ